MKMEIGSEVENDYARIKKLIDLDFNNYDLQEEFGDLVTLASSIAGTEFCNLNIINNYFQWTVASKGFEIRPVLREESVCDLTMKQNIPLEIPRLDRHERFENKNLVTQMGLTYYLGFPLILNSGEKIGALCVFDREEKKVSNDKVEQLNLLSAEVVNKLENLMKIKNLENALGGTERDLTRLAHDIRSPLSGITNLSEALVGEEISGQEFLDYLEVIGQAGSGILELTEDILNKSQRKRLKEETFNSKELGERLVHLYGLAASTKNIEFKVDFGNDQTTQFPRMKLLSVIGNIICNAIKFTSPGGWVHVNLKIYGADEEKKLLVQVKDNGIGISNSSTEKINNGTKGEKGFGLGLELVREVLKEWNGRLDIDKDIREGTIVRLEIPIA